MLTNHRRGMICYLLMAMFIFSLVILSYLKVYESFVEGELLDVRFFNITVLFLIIAILICYSFARYFITKARSSRKNKAFCNKNENIIEKITISFLEGLFDK